MSQAEFDAALALLTASSRCRVSPVVIAAVCAGYVMTPSPHHDRLTGFSIVTGQGECRLNGGTDLAQGIDLPRLYLWERSNDIGGHEENGSWRRNGHF
jgi:hypothetical protein